MQLFVFVFVFKPGPLLIPHSEIATHWTELALLQTYSLVIWVNLD